MAEFIALAILVAVTVYLQKRDLKRRMEWQDKWNKKIQSDFSKSLGAVWDEDGHFLGFENEPKEVEANRKRWEQAKRNAEAMTYSTSGWTK